MKKREFKQRAWKCVKAFVADKDYESAMDDMTVACSDAQWKELQTWIDVAREVLKLPEVVEVGAAPLPLIRSRLESRFG
jgi:biotin carboxylase